MNATDDQSDGEATLQNCCVAPVCAPPPIRLADEGVLGDGPQGRSSNSRRVLVWALGGWLLILGGARLAPHFPIPLPVCGLRALTGFPCPLCGSTRCLLAWSHFEIAQAFRFNPLLAVGSVAFCTWLALSLLGVCSGRKWAAHIAERAQRKPWPAVLAAAALANWVYLVFYLPK